MYWCKVHCTSFSESGTFWAHSVTSNWFCQMFPARNHVVDSYELILLTKNILHLCVIAHALSLLSRLHLSLSRPRCGSRVLVRGNQNQFSFLMGRPATPLFVHKYSKNAVFCSLLLISFHHRTKWLPELVLSMQGRRSTLHLDGSPGTAISENWKANDFFNLGATIHLHPPAPVIKTSPMGAEVHDVPNTGSE